MPAPTTITPKGWDVVFEIEDTVNYVTSRDPKFGFGTVVLIGMNVLTTKVGDVVGGMNCDFFQEGSYMYAITSESNIKFKYTAPP